jgi:uncharacterized membrane protein YphA (DoxX/SURF4 family)
VQKSETLKSKIMATLTANYVHATSDMTKVQRVTQTLRITYGLLPILAGLDKFMHLLADWNKYLAPVVTDVIPVSPGTFMSVGVIEIIAGIIVFVRPKLGSIIVGIWLIAIAINLLLTGQYFDVAVRDVIMAIGAFCLYMLLDDDRSVNQRPNP